MSLSVTISILFLFLALVFFFVLAIAIRYRKKVRENTELRVKFNHAMLQSQLEIREQTLKYLSYELHDNLGQIASLVKINLATLQLDDPIIATEQVADIRELVRHLLRDIKDLSIGLGSNQLVKHGITGAVQTEVSRLNKTRLFRATLVVTGPPVDLELDRATIIFRILQESMNNAIRHSQGTDIELGIANLGKSAIFHVKDNGVGFDPDILNTSVGSGLRHLKERTAVLGAELNITSSASQGTTVRVQIIT